MDYGCNSRRIDDPSELMSVMIQSKFHDQFMLDNVMFLTMHTMSERTFDHASGNNFVEFKALSKGFPARVHFTYRKVITKLMPIPYDTHCIEIQKGKENLFSSARDCYMSCYAERFAQRYSSYPTELPQSLDQQGSKLMQTFDPGNDPEVEKMYESCQSKCGQDCLQTNYFVKYIATKPNDDVWELHLFPPPESTVRIVSSPAISLLDVLCLMLTAASFWFTFCPANLLLSHRITRKLKTSPSPEAVVKEQQPVVQREVAPNDPNEVTQRARRAKQMWDQIRRHRLDIILQHRFDMIAASNVRASKWRVQKSKFKLRAT